MNKIFTTALFLLVLTSLVFGGGQQQQDMGSDTYEYNLNGFTGIDGSGAFDIEVKRDNKFSVLIIANKSLKNKLIIEKRGNKLVLGMKPFSGFSFSIKSPKAIITMPELDQIQLSSASSMIAAGFDSNNDLSVGLSGASSLDIDILAGNITFGLSGASDMTGVIEADDVRIDLSGSSDIELYGYGKELIVDASSASSGDLREFQVQDAHIQLSGSSDLHVNMNGTLNIDASGASTLYYTGNVTIGENDLSGASSIKQE